MHLADALRFMVCEGIVPLSAADVLRSTAVDVASRRLLRDPDVLRFFADVMGCGRIANCPVLLHRWSAQSRCLECGTTTGCTPALSSSGGLRARFCTRCTTREGGFRQLVDRRRCRREGLSRARIKGLRVAKVGTRGQHLFWASALRDAR